MRRVVCRPRTDWPQKAERLGFTYHGQGEGLVYWDESAAYAFTEAEIDRIEAATETLHGLCLAAIDHVVEREPGWFDRFGVPPGYRDYIRASWRRRDPYLMGRLDLAFDPATGAVKLLEYNADTPTTVIETALMQWYWLEETKAGPDQFNSLHEKLIERLGVIRGLMPPGALLHVATVADGPEELAHCGYFMDLAREASIVTAFIDMRRIGWSDKRRCFLDEAMQPIRFLHKLYPWEWLAAEQFGRYLPLDGVGVIEPVWKMLLSNKALLVLLWQLNPGHPLLLPAGWHPGEVGPDYVVKPILGREGANIALVRDGAVVVGTDGTYGGVAMVYQQAATLPVFEGRHVVIGSWLVGEQAAGMILREGDTPILTGDSRVVPHFFA